MLVRNLRLLFSTVLLCTLLTACYRIDIPQGNVFSDYQAKHIKRGMTTAQVVAKLGSPVLINSFIDNRLIYVYSYKPSVGRFHKKHLYIYFANNRVTGIQQGGDLENPPRI